MIDRKIDSFITTNNGINTHTYTGNELGKKAFVAKTSNVVSQPTTIWDTLWHDELIGSHKSSWQNPTTDLVVADTDNGLSITYKNGASGWKYFWYNDPTISTVNVGGRNSITTPCVIEMEVTSITGTITWDIMGVDTSHHLDNDIVRSTGLWKAVLDGTDLRVYKDGVQQSWTSGGQTKNSLYMPDSNIRVGFALNGANENIIFKNFKVYSY